MPARGEVLDFQKADLKKPRSYRAQILNQTPSNWAELDNINWQQKIILDVGCGRGDSTLYLAKSNPEAFVIGIERTTEKFRKGTDLFKIACPLNSKLIHADAVPLIENKVPRACVDEIYFLYPNPTPKKRQANQRFAVSPSFEVFLTALQKNGKIIFASNVKSYIEETQAFCEKFWNLKLTNAKTISQNQNPRTLFEKKYLERKENIMQIEFQKIET